MVVIFLFHKMQKLLLYLLNEKKDKYMMRCYVPLDNICMLYSMKKKCNILY